MNSLARPARLEDKVLVIIGGTSGIGFSAARAFLSDGACVVVVGRDPSRIENAGRDLGERALAIAGDAQLAETPCLAIEAARKHFGGFDGLFHVAGGSGRSRGDGPLHEITPEGWEFTLGLNLTSVFHSNRAAVSDLLNHGSTGSIVNCGSVLGFSPSPHFFATHAYATAKAGLIGLTRAAASHYAAQGIRFNVLAPGLVATAMSERAQSNADVMEFIRTKQPLGGGRIGKPEDLDGAVVWLMSDESRFVTGQVIAVDGGWAVSDGQWKSNDGA